MKTIGNPSQDNDNIFLELANVYRRSVGRIEMLLSGRSWIFIATGMTILVSLFMAFPNYGGLSVLPGYIEKAKHPFEAFGEPGTHEANLTYRLTGALLCHMLAPSQAGHLIFMAICTALLLLSVIMAVFRITGDKVTAFFVGMAVACAYPGSAGFATGLFPYDPLGYLLVVAPFVSKNPIWIFVSCFLAGWTDERAFVGTSFALLNYSMVANGGALVNSRSIAVVFAWGVYLAGRFALARVLDLPPQSPTNYLLELKGNARFLHFCSYYALEGLWLIVVTSAVVSWRAKRRLVVLGMGVLLSVQFFLAFVLNDMTRAAAYVLPVIFPALGLLMFHSRSPIPWLRPLTCGAAVLSVIGLNYFVISWPGTDRCIFKPTSPLPLRVVEWSTGVRAG